MLESPLVLEDVTDELGSAVDVIEISTPVDVDLDVDRVVKPGIELVCDAELPEEDGTIVGTPDIGVVAGGAESEGLVDVCSTGVFGYSVVVVAADVLM